MKHGNLLLAKSAIYGFAEAARPFWFTPSHSMTNTGWQRSVFEDVLFTLRRGGVRTPAVTHVEGMWARRQNSREQRSKTWSGHLRDDERRINMEGRDQARRHLAAPVVEDRSGSAPQEKLARQGLDLEHLAGSQRTRGGQCVANVPKMTMTMTHSEKSNIRQ